MTKPIVNLNVIVTKQGDKGCSLKGCGVFANKSDPWFELMGSVDELNASIGIAAYNEKTTFNGISFVQNALFDLGSQLYNANIKKLTPQYTQHLESLCEEYKKTQEDLQSFMVPVGSCSYWHLSRSITRRAERAFWKLLLIDNSHDEEIGRFLNRLSDLLFLIARASQLRNNQDLVCWQPGALEIEKS